MNGWKPLTAGMVVCRQIVQIVLIGIFLRVLIGILYDLLRFGVPGAFSDGI
jgi:hypothetical protein